MRKDIRYKLQQVLNKDHLEEVEVVYILSRIRKLLEIDENRTDFKVLKFYCNWALHIQIDDVIDPIRTILEKPGWAISLMHLYPNLDDELKKFLSKYNLETKIFLSKQNCNRFHHLLSEIYSDTPLIVKTTRKRKITITKVESYGENSGTFSGTCEDI